MHDVGGWVALTPHGVGAAPDDALGPVPAIPAGMMPVEREPRRVSPLLRCLCLPCYASASFPLLCCLLTGGSCLPWWAIGKLLPESEREGRDGRNGRDGRDDGV